MREYILNNGIFSILPQDKDQVQKAFSLLTDSVLFQAYGPDGPHGCCFR